MNLYNRPVPENKQVAFPLDYIAIDHQLSALESDSLLRRTDLVSSA